MNANFVEAPRRYVDMQGVEACIMTDDANNHLLVRRDGEVYRLLERDDGTMTIRPFASADTSKKNDGYLVSVFQYFDVWAGIIRPYRVRNHLAVAFCFKHDEYEELVEDGVDNPIVNHKDNCPWHNDVDNLEWVTQSLNVRHGRMVSSINKYYDTFTHIENNRSKTEFVTLNQPLSAYDLERFAEETGEDISIKKSSADDYSGYYSQELVDKFIDWLYIKGIWKTDDIDINIK